MPSVWRSTHPDVLAWWEDVQKRDKRYRREARKVEKQFDRNLMLRTGFGDESVSGLARKYNEDPLPGWKFGHGGRRSGYMEPRHSARGAEEKAAAEAARAVIKRLNDLRPSVRSECHERFGTPVFQFFGLHAISPGMFEHDGVFWLTFGTHDYDPPVGGTVEEQNGHGGPTMLDYFEPAKKSEFYAAREAAGLEDEDVA
jgi:hypothetical protein